VNLSANLHRRRGVPGQLSGREIPSRVSRSRQMAGLTKALGAPRQL
jgi:hypothetical protein